MYVKLGDLLVFFDHLVMGLDRLTRIGWGKDVIPFHLDHYLVARLLRWVRD
jgi:hypothetical protein